MSNYDRAAYDLGVGMGLASYQLSVPDVSVWGVSLSRPLIISALDQALSAGQSLKSIVIYLNLTTLSNIRSAMSYPINRIALHNTLASLRDGNYYQSIMAASPRLALVYLLGANFAIAEGQVSRDPNNLGGNTTVAARYNAINHLVNARSNIYALSSQGLNLSPNGPNELLAMFTAGRLNRDIHPRATAIRVTYGDTVRAAP